MQVGDDTFGQSTVQNFKDNSVNAGCDLLLFVHNVEIKLIQNNTALSLQLACNISQNWNRMIVLIYL